MSSWPPYWSFIVDTYAADIYGIYGYFYDGAGWSIYAMRVMRLLMPIFIDDIDIIDMPDDTLAFDG